MARNPKPVLKVILKGPGVRSGRIAVPDLIRVCEEAQNAITRQAEAIEGRKAMHPGPAKFSVRNRCTLELIAIKRGSTELDFAFADPQLRLDGVESLGVDAITELTKTIKALGNGASRSTKNKSVGEIAEGVLHGIIALGRVAQMEGISEIRWVAPAGAKSRMVSAPINDSVTKAVAKRLSRPRRAIATIDGYLEMADFKPRDRKCRIEPAMGPPVTCTFTADFEDTVNTLIRRPVRVTGEGVFPANSERVETIEIKQIDPLKSLDIEGYFFANLNLADLAKMQDVSPIKDSSTLVGGFPADEDIDEFLKDIYENRR